jgi:short chain dehydrogenase
MSRKFGCNTTGEDVLKGTDLSGKTAVVTGTVSAAPVSTVSNACMHAIRRHELVLYATWSISAFNITVGVSNIREAYLNAGGNAGLGRETVRVLAAAGADVVFTSRSAERGQQVAKEIEAGGVKVCIVSRACRPSYRIMGDRHLTIA